MSRHSLLYDVAKAKQAEVSREVEFSRISRSLRRDRKSTSLAKKLRTFLTTTM